MIKRPLNARFSQAVLEGRKFTTIREKPWPTKTPIMLYNWSGIPYRSKHINIGTVVVSGWWLMKITHITDGKMQYAYGLENPHSLYEVEGFNSQDELDEWFRAIVKPGQSVSMYLMRFRLVKAAHTR